jgi:hypothetical protein
MLSNLTLYPLSGFLGYKAWTAEKFMRFSSFTIFTTLRESGLSGDNSDLR